MDAKQILVLGASVLAAFSGGSAMGKDSKEPYVRMYSSGESCFCSAASGKPGTLFSKIQR